MEANTPDQTWTYEEIAVKARSLRAAVGELGLQMHRDSALSLLLREAEALARDWKEGRRDGGIKRLMHAAHANRVADAIESARFDVGALECIRRMCSNNMDLSGRVPSRGKDALWELDLAWFLKRRGVTVKHSDPPDLVADFGFGHYPIACKKVYSERGIESQVRQGAKQLERHGSAGLVAINFDDLTPPDALLRSATQAEASEYLARFNHEVIDRNQARLQRFVVDGRCDGVLVSTTSLADIAGSKVRFNTHTQTTLWTLSSRGAVQAERWSRIRTALEIKP
jgi:hypothetical protein